MKQINQPNRPRLTVFARRKKKMIAPKLADREDARKSVQMSFRVDGVHAIDGRASHP
jgi:hypothetical protein